MNMCLEKEPPSGRGHEIPGAKPITKETGAEPQGIRPRSSIFLKIISLLKKKEKAEELTVDPLQEINELRLSLISTLYVINMLESYNYKEKEKEKFLLHEKTSDGIKTQLERLCDELTKLSQQLAKTSLTTQNNLSVAVDSNNIQLGTLLSEPTPTQKLGEIIATSEQSKSIEKQLGDNEKRHIKEIENNQANPQQKVDAEEELLKRRLDSILDGLELIEKLRKSFATHEQFKYTEERLADNTNQIASISTLVNATDQRLNTLLNDIDPSNKLSEAFAIRKQFNKIEADLMSNTDVINTMSDQAKETNERLNTLLDDIDPNKKLSEKFATHEQIEKIIKQLEKNAKDTETVTQQAQNANKWLNTLLDGLDPSTKLGEKFVTHEQIGTTQKQLANHASELKTQKIKLEGIIAKLNETVFQPVLGSQIEQNYRSALNNWLKERRSKESFNYTINSSRYSQFNLRRVEKGMEANSGEPSFVLCDARYFTAIESFGKAVLFPTVFLMSYSDAETLCNHSVFEEMTFTQPCKSIRIIEVLQPAELEQIGARYFVKRMGRLKLEFGQ
jgi:hypothetical protein